MPYQTETTTLQSNIVADGATVTTGELDAVDAFLVSIGGTIKAKLKEVHIPVGSNATAARRRLIFKSGASQSAALADFSNSTGALGAIASAVVSTTDFLYSNVSFGVLLSPGFSPSSFGILFGANSTDINLFSYDWAGGYNKVRGYTLGFSPNFAPNPLDDGDTFLYAPSWDGMLAFSGGASEHFIARDGEVVMYNPIALASVGSPISTGTPLYLPFATAPRWHASFAGSYLTRAEMAVVSTALRICASALGRSNIPALKTRRVAGIGDSRWFTTTLASTSFPETLYKQLRDQMGWGAETEMWDYGFPGLKLDTTGEPYPTVATWQAIPRTTGARGGRLSILFRALNDLNTGASPATAKTRLDTLLSTLKTAGHRVLVCSEVAAQAFSGDVAGYNALLVADAGLTDGTKAFGLVRIDQIARISPSDRGDNGYVVTGSAATDTIDLPLNHGLANGDEVAFTALTGGAGLSTSTRYFIRDVASISCKLAATSGGAAINITSDLVTTYPGCVLVRNRSCTASASTDVVTTATPHGFSNGDELQFTGLTGGAGIPSATRVFARDVTSLTFKLAATSGGAAIDITSNLTAGVVQREGTSLDGVHWTELGSTYLAAAIAAGIPKVLAVPTINSASSGSATRGEAFEHDITVNTALSIGPYTYGATGLPAGLSIDSATGIISGTPTAAAGSYSLSLTATNENGSSTAQTYNLTILAGYTAMPELYEDYRNWVTATGRFILTPADDTENPIDLGDISITRLGVNPQETKSYRNRGGTRKLINQKLIEISPEFEITIGEENRFNVGIRLFGKQLSDDNQAAATAATKTFNNVKHGSTQDLGKVNVSNVSVVVGVTTKTAGTDYSVDAALGLIRILDGGTIVSGTDDIVVTFDHPAQGYSKFQTFVKLNRSGRGKLFVEDEYSDAPRGIHEFDVNVATSDPGEMGAQKPTEWKAKLSILGNATYKHRKLAA